MRRDAITIGQIPAINRKIDAVRQARPLVAAAGGHALLLAHVRTGRHQAATGAAPPTGALAQCMTGTDPARPEQVQQQAPRHATGQDDPLPKGWLSIDQAITLHV